MLPNFQLTKFNIVLIFICLFLLSAVIHFYPVWYKGYTYSFNAENLAVAKNLYLTGQYSLKDSQDVVLSSDLIKAQGVAASTENKLTPLIYTQVLKIFGFQPWLPIKISIFFYALTGLICLVLAWRLFNLKLGLIFGLIFIFTPHISAYSIKPGLYEFALFFFSLALLFYLWDYQATNKSGNYFRLGLSSIFFALAFLARNVFLISFIPFLIYDFFKNKSLPRVIIFILPFIILSSLVLMPDFLAGYPHIYLGKYVGQSAELAGWDGHCFPDPYTYYFAREEYLKEILPTARGDVAACLLTYGYQVNFKNKILLYLDSFKYYLEKSLRLITFGGPIMLAFLLFGLVTLLKRNKKLFQLFIFWFVFWLAVLIALQTSNLNHFLEISFPVILLMSLGIYQSCQWLDKKYLLIALLCLSVLGHLIIADQWLFHERYNTSQMEQVLVLVEAIKKHSLTSQDVIAVDTHPSFVSQLNYLTDKNFVYFRPATIENLLAKNQLADAFDKFRVTKIIGYQEELTKKIIQVTEVENID